MSILFYRVRPPNQSTLLAWIDGKNLDGSNNSTLTAGATVGSVINLGSSGGTWTNIYIPGDSNAPKLNTSGAGLDFYENIVNPFNKDYTSIGSGGTPICNFPTNDITLCVVFTHNTTPTAGARILRNLNTPNVGANIYLYSDAGLKYYMDYGDGNGNAQVSTTIIPSLATRYCLIAQYKVSTNTFRFKVASFDQSVTPPNPPITAGQHRYILGKVQFGNLPWRGTLDTFLSWNDSNVDFSAIESFIASKYGPIAT